MDINELNSFKLSDAVKFHDKLNPKLWKNDQMEPLVRDQLLVIARDFVENLGIKDLDIVDVIVSGSNAAFSYTPHSDLDLHIVVNMNDLHNDEVYRELFRAKKTLYNDSHEITVHGVPVELYVQDAAESNVSLGEYSILNDKWNKIPKRKTANLDQPATKAKYEQLADLIRLAVKTRDENRVSRAIDLIRRYRKAGLDKGGEFSPENLAYKALRTQGKIDELYDVRDELHSEKLSIEEQLTEAYTSKQQVIDHFVKNRKYASSVSAATKQGAAAWDRGWRGPKPKKLEPKPMPSNVRLPYKDDLDEASSKEDAIRQIRLLLNKSGRNPNEVDAIEGVINNMMKRYGIKPYEINTNLNYADQVRVERAKAEKEAAADALRQEWDKFKSSLNTFAKQGHAAYKKQNGDTNTGSMFNKVTEASGYIPSNKQRNDPRYSTALTVDIRPDAIKKNAKAFGFKTSRAGIPPLANPNGKV